MSHKHNWLILEKADYETNGADYETNGEGYNKPEDVTQIESGELEVMLDKDTADILYVSNQVARFDEVEVIEIKAYKKEGD